MNFQITMNKTGEIEYKKQNAKRQFKIYFFILIYNLTRLNYK